MEQLLDKGADVNFANKEGETVLFYAARRNQPAIARLLLQRGADCTIKDRYGDLAIDHVPKSSTSLIKAFEQQNSLTKMGNSIENNRKCKILSPFDFCTYNDLLRIYEYLCVSEVLRCACVASKWHRVSENPAVWMRLGIRRWELALQSSLGFQPSTTSGFYRPSLSSKPKQPGTVSDNRRDKDTRK